MVMLDTIFSDTVARGWKPVTPAFEPEVSRLPASRVRGTCIAPLTFDGDIVYVDPNTPAQPGDVVSFALSARACKLQNSDLPPGQTPWQPGARWLKLLCHHHGFDFLLEKYGASITTTLAACESPNDVPQLAPVRNIRRDGRLLFTPDSYTSGLGLNAATFVAEASVTNVNMTGSVAAVVSQTVGPFSAACTVVCTASGYLTSTYTASGLTWPPELAYAISTTSASLPTGHPYFHPTPVPGVNTYGTNFTYEQSFSLGAGTTATYYFNGACTDLVTDASMEFNALVLKTECIFR